MPHIDFRRMTAGAVGVAWRQASPEQRDRLEQSFKALLVRILSGALDQARSSGTLAKARGRQVVVLPLRADAEASEVTVRTQLRGGAGEPVPLDYRLARDGDAWKIVDVNVLGVWMVAQYRNEFAPVLRDQGIDGLIAALSARTLPGR